MDDQKQPEPHPLDIPDFLVRDPVTNTAEFMMSEQAQEIMKERAKTKSKPAQSQPKAKETKQSKSKEAKPSKEKVAKAKPDKVKAKAKAAKAPPKAVKAKAKTEKSLEKDQFGLRKGSTRSTAAAMYARKSGATLEEVKTAVGSIQLNVLKELEANGFVVEKEKQTREGKRPMTRYWLKAAK